MTASLSVQTLLFDLDDTLVHCNKYFDLIVDQFADQMTTWFSTHKLAEEDVRSKQLEIDTARVGRNGFVPEHFPRSLVATYDYFADLYGRPRSRKEADWLMKLGSSVYEREVEPYPDMEETLSELAAQGHKLCLYTGGVAKIQLKKVTSLRLDRFFGDRMFVRQHKTTSSLEAILHDNGFDRHRTWMIGNSLRTDIVPALETGIHSIYIPAVREWEYNIVEITAKPQGAFLTIKSLKEVPSAIELYLREQAAGGH